MNFVSTGVCSAQYLNNLGGHTTALDAMVSFCKVHWRPASRFASGGKVAAYRNHLYSFYIFSGVTSSKDGDDHYAHRFKEFIREFGLGEVIYTKAKVNGAFHPEHGNQFYIWSPDEGAVSKWYGDHLKVLEEAARAKLEAKHIPLLDDGKADLYDRGYDDIDDEWVPDEAYDNFNCLD